MSDLVSQREFARRLGVSPPAVGKAIKSGRIHGAAVVGSKLDFVLASKQFKANCDIAKKRKPQKKKSVSKVNKPKTIKKENIAAVPLTDLKEIEDNPIFNESHSIEELEEQQNKKGFEQKVENALSFQRVRKEKANADIAEYKASLARGKLIEVEKLETAIFETFKAFREHVLRFPSNYSADIAAEFGLDKVQVQKFLNEKMKEHCRKLKGVKLDAKNLSK